MFSQFHKIFDALSNRERRVWLVALLVLAVALFLGGINFFYHRTTVAPVSGGRYIEGIVGQPTFLNPLLSHTDIDRSINTLLYASVLDFVEQHKVSEDHKTWSLILKPDILWSDGERITTDDILFTIEAIKDPETRSPLAATWQGIATERISEREIRFILRNPYAFFLDNLKDLKIVPQHIFGTIPTANLRISDYNLEPVGAGPYVFDRFEKRKDGFITTYYFKANPDYPGKETLIEEFVVKFFPTYEETIAAFNKKDIDAVGGLDYSHLEQLKITHEISSIEMPRYYALFMNQSAHDALKEKSVRTALSLAINKENIVGNTFLGHATSFNGPIHPRIEGHDPSIYIDDTYSPEEAKELLEETRWSLDEETGIRSKSIGGELVSLEFAIVVPDISFLRDSISHIQNDWKQIGVNLIPVIMSPGEVVQEAIKTRNYQIILFGNILRKNPDVFSFWHSSERFSPGLNLSLYEDRSVDLLLETIRKDFDNASRNESVSELQAQIHSDVPAIFLFSPHYLYAHPKDLGGFTSNLIVSPANRFDEIYAWYLKTARIFK